MLKQEDTFCSKRTQGGNQITDCNYTTTNKYSLLIEHAALPSSAAFRRLGAVFRRDNAGRASCGQWTPTAHTHLHARA